MSQNKYKLAEKALAQQLEVVSELEGITKSIERCEKTILDLAQELESVNRKHQGRKTTQDDIDYLTDLLNCARKKLGWEKQMASLQKRIPTLLTDVSKVMNDPGHPPADNVRAQMAAALQRVQSAMERLDAAKVS